MSIDAGSINSSVRVKLDALAQDIKKVTTEFDKIGVGIDKQAKEVTKKNKSIMDSFRSLQSVMQGPVAALGFLKGAFDKVLAVTSELESAWAEQEQAIAILEATLKATGATAWTSSEAIQAMASEFQSFTKYGDETVLTMQNVLLGFKNIKGDNFKEASLQILNMATVMDMDLKSAAQAVGKALDDPIAGIDALSRQGFRFSQDQKDMLKAMVETGDIAKAQAIILDELATTYGGAAEAAGLTGSAIKTRLNNALGDTRELAGKAITEGLAPMRLALLEMVTEYNNNATSSGTLKSATNELITASENYNGLVKKLTENTGTLTDEERKLLEVRKSIAGNDVFLAMNKLVSTYDKTKATVANLKKELSDLDKQKNEQAARTIKINDMTVASYKTEYGIAISQIGLEKLKASAQSNYAGILKKITNANAELTNITQAQAESINGIARAVKNGVVNIDDYKLSNRALYNQIMEVASGLDAVDAATKKKADSDKAAADATDKATASAEKASASAKKTEKELQDQIDGRKAAEEKYNAEVKKANDLITDQKKLQDSLNRSAEKYRDTLYDLGYANESEVGTRGQEAYLKMIEILKDVTEETEDTTKAAGELSTEQLAGIQKVIDATESLGKKEEDGIETSRKAAIQAIEDSGLIGEQKEALIKKTNEYYDLLKDKKASADFAKNITESISLVMQGMSAYANLVNQLNKNMVDSKKAQLDEEFDLLEKNLKRIQSAEKDALKERQEDSLSALELELNNKLYYDGLAKASTVAQYADELAQAILTGDAIQIQAAQDALDKATIQEEYNKKITELKDAQAIEAKAIDERQKEETIALEKQKAKEKADIEYDAMLASWEIQLAMATAMAVQTALNMFTSAAAVPVTGWLTAPIAGGIGAAFGALQVGAVLAAKPKTPKFETGGIVPGRSFSGDQVPILANSREGIFTLEQQKQLFDMANGNGSGSSVTLNIGTLVADDAGLRELERRMRSVSIESSRRG